MSRSQNSFIKKKKADEKRKKKKEKMDKRLERNKEKQLKSDNQTADESFDKMMMSEEEANAMRKIVPKQRKSAPGAQ